MTKGIMVSMDFFLKRLSYCGNACLEFQVLRDIVQGDERYSG